MHDLTNLGPLTTRYSPVGSGCYSSILVIHISIYSFVEGDETRTFRRSGNAIRTYGDITSSLCYPPNYMTTSDFQPGYGKVRYYSPGVCPSGYDIALSWEGPGEETGIGNDAAKRDIEGSSRETTTAICCPR